MSSLYRCCAAALKSECQYATIVIYRGDLYKHFESNRGKREKEKSARERESAQNIVFINWASNFIGLGVIIHICIGMYILSAFLQWLSGKESPWNAEDAWDMGSIPVLGRILEESMTTHSSILVGTIPWTEEPSGLQPIESQGECDWRTVYTCTDILQGTFTYIIIGVSKRLKYTK